MGQCLHAQHNCHSTNICQDSITSFLLLLGLLTSQVVKEKPLHNNTFRSSEAAHVKASLERHLSHSHTGLKGAYTNARNDHQGNVPSGINVHPPAYAKLVFGSTSFTWEFLERRQCLAVACKKREKRQAVSHQAKKSKEIGVTCNTFNKSGKQLPHVHVQWHNTSCNNTSPVGRPGASSEGTKHTQPQSTHVWDTTCYGRLGTHLGPSREQTQNIFFMLKQTNQQVIPIQHDQAGTSFKEGRSWCPNKTYPMKSLKETNEQYFKYQVYNSRCSKVLSLFFGLG